MNPVEIIAGDGPIVLGMPHIGTYIPDGIAVRLNERGLQRADTDWWIDQLYADLLPHATVVKATFSRTVIDANRDPSGVSLYPGQNTTGLCPTTDFDDQPIYHFSAEPGVDEIKARRLAYHQPYHNALRTALNDAKARHGVAILYDCHSIRSFVPHLFEGQLPVFNIGTNEGETCAPSVEAAVTETCAAAPDFDYVVNGRFKGGWTTRHYGQPDEGFHAVQMELAQRVYMNEDPPWTYDPALADQVRPVLKTILTRLEALALSGDL